MMTYIKKKTYKFFFISEEKLFTILNFDFSSYRFLAYKELASSLDRDILVHTIPKITSSYTFRFYIHLNNVYEGKLFGLQFNPVSYAYSFFLGLYFFFVWSLG